MGTSFSCNILGIVSPPRLVAGSDDLPSFLIPEFFIMFYMAIVREKYYDYSLNEYCQLGFCCPSLLLIKKNK
jgi:hypothetical protein